MDIAENTLEIITKTLGYPQPSQSDIWVSIQNELRFMKDNTKMYGARHDFFGIMPITTEPIQVKTTDPTLFSNFSFF